MSSTFSTLFKKERRDIFGGQSYFDILSGLGVSDVSEMSVLFHTKIYESNGGVPSIGATDTNDAYFYMTEEDWESVYYPILDFTEDVSTNGSSGSFYNGVAWTTHYGSFLMSITGSSDWSTWTERRFKDIPDDHWIVVPVISGRLYQASDSAMWDSPAVLGGSPTPKIFRYLMNSSSLGGSAIIKDTGYMLVKKPSKSQTVKLKGGDNYFFEDMTLVWKPSLGRVSYNLKMSLDAVSVNTQYAEMKVAFFVEGTETTEKTLYEIFDTQSKLQAFDTVEKFPYPDEVVHTVDLLSFVGTNGEEVVEKRIDCDDFLPTDPDNPYEAVNTKRERFLMGDYGDLPKLKYYIYGACLTTADDLVDLVGRVRYEIKTSNEIFAVADSDFTVSNATLNAGVYTADTAETPDVTFKIDNVLYSPYMYARLYETTSAETLIEIQMFRDEAVEFTQTLSGSQKWKIDFRDESGLVMDKSFAFETSDGSVSAGSSSTIDSGGSGDSGDSGGSGGSGGSTSIGSPNTGLEITDVVIDLDGVEVNTTLDTPLYHNLVF